MKNFCLLTHHKVSKKTWHKLKRGIAIVTDGQKYKKLQKYLIIKRNIKNFKYTLGLYYWLQPIVILLVYY